MARPLRIERAGGWYHLTARGNEQQPIFRSPRDYQHFSELLAETVERFRWRLHAYVLMRNHFHLFVETLDPNLSASMQWLGVSYTVWFNRKHQRVGHLFQGRFKSIIVDPAAWSVSLSHYIHLNPVRISALKLGKSDRAAAAMPDMRAPEAGLVRQRLQELRAFRWSSYPAYIGSIRPPTWLTCAHILEHMGKGTLAERRRRYQTDAENMLREGLPPSPWEQLKGQVALGSEKFLRKIRSALSGNRREQPGLRQPPNRPRWQHIMAALEKIKGEPWLEFRDRYGDTGRDLALYLGRKHCQLKLAELGTLAGGMDYASVATALRRCEARLKRDKRLARQAQQAIRQMYNVKM